MKLIFINGWCYMLKISQSKIRDLSKITGHSAPLISKYFKDFNEDKVTRVNNRIIGITPEAVEEYFTHIGLAYFYQPAVILSGNLCGGVGKTTGVQNLGIAWRRISNRKRPLVYIDGDSQGSFTAITFGKQAEDDEPILIDFLEGKASIDDILTDLGDNIWFIKSNLNQVWIDKVLSKPQDIKKGMLRFYQAIFDKFGQEAVILQDHTPQLSTLFASSICALHQLNPSILKAVIIPLRSDKFAIQGGEYILKEIEELQDTFSLENNIDIHCYFSSIDRRVSTTSEALKVARNKETIVTHLSSVVIRYCSEIPKSINAASNVYSSGKNNHAAEDYQDLLQYIFSFNEGAESNG